MCVFCLCSSRHQIVRYMATVGLLCQRLQNLLDETALVVLLMVFHSEIQIVARTNSFKLTFLNISRPLPRDSKLAV